MAATTGKQTKRWTYEQYYKLEGEQRYEIMDGQLLIVPAPNTWHQDWLNNLNIFITSYVRRKKLGRLFIAPVDVVLDDENTVQPDLVFVAAKNLGIIQRRAIFGTPDLLVEFVSPSSVRRDRYEKLQLYARFGVGNTGLATPPTTRWKSSFCPRAATNFAAPPRKTAC